MATHKKRIQPVPSKEEFSLDGSGFDVICSIGRVEFGPNGTELPHVAAFKLIAEHDAEGVFKFPMANGQTCSVEVNFEGEAPQPAPIEEF